MRYTIPMAVIILGMVLAISAICAAALLYHWFSFSISKELTFGVLIYLFGLALGIVALLNQFSPFI